ncbi:hypothetical protein BJ878DRAFT_542868 [Calycina marina]|uniref:K Homology domain-containing protein n=1 Tax=Calycina marina TaxID=1763456 RepID=A0A9P7Z1U7_9HELO|nr:hypothetical protein BJ878DRAFT_542868 [Calycina marina]
MLYPAGVNSDETEVLHQSEFDDLTMQVCVLPTQEALIRDGQGGGDLIEEESKAKRDENGTARVDKVVLPGAVGQKTRRFLNHDWVSSSQYLQHYTIVAGPSASSLVSAGHRAGGSYYLRLQQVWLGVIRASGDDYETEDEAQATAAKGKVGYVLNGSKVETEDTMTVFAGSIGKIIGPKGTIYHVSVPRLATEMIGATMYEIQDATHAELTIPKKDEDAPKPRAHDAATVTLKGTQDSIELAKVRVQAIVDE